MFGVVMILVWFVCWIIKSYQETSRNNYLRTYSGDKYIYRDIHSVTRLKSNNQIVIEKNDSATGHRLFYDRNHNLVLDATEDEMLKKTAENPDQPVAYDKIRYASYYIHRFVKQINGRLKYYTTVHYKDADFIVDLDTMKILSPTSKQLRYEMVCRSKGYLNYTDEGFREVIDGFNALDEIDRHSIIAEFNGSHLTNTDGSYWSNFLYNERKPRQHWSYFHREDRPWIK